MRKTVGIAALLFALAVPSPALALRYVSPTGNSANDCDTVGSACDLYTAIEGTGGNMPENGEEVIVLAGSYTAATDIIPTATGLNIHGALNGPRPVITISGLGQIQVSSGSISYLQLEGNASSWALNLSGGTAERLFMRGATSGGAAFCQCYGGVLRDSVIISTGVSPALGITSNDGSSTATYRNVTAYAANPLAPTIRISQQGTLGILNATAYNTVALHGGGGTEVFVDGPNSTLTFSHSNYRTTDVGEGGVIQDAPGETHQTAAPMFASPATGDFSEVVGSPTIDAGVTDPLNGSLDFAGNPRASGSSTDIGALELQVPPVNTQPGGPTGKKCKKKRKKKKKKKTGSTAAKKKKKKGCKKKKRKKK